MKIEPTIKASEAQTEEFSLTARACMAGAISAFSQEHKMAPVSTMVTMLQYTILTLADLDRETTLDYCISFLEAMSETDPEKVAQAQATANAAFDQLSTAAQMTDMKPMGTA